MALILAAIFFLSGASGVLFETLWFRVMGLTLGNGVWASNIVLASFMAGLAAGNGIAARYGRNVRFPLQLCAAIEGVVALTGIAIVVLLPSVSPAVGRLFTQVLSQAWLVNVFRLSLAFSVMLVPATAMGLTLPLLAKATARYDANFGRAFGRLYGLNTLGGMAGALCGELWLIGWLGQRGTALAAGALDLVAAGALLLMQRAVVSATTTPEAPSTRPAGGRPYRLLAATFLAGATLLALEVIWFRFLQLFVYGTSLIFAVMLAIVLLGIGAGGVVGAQWLGRDPRAQRFAPVVALAAGVAVELSYAWFKPGLGSAAYLTGNTAAAFTLFIRLMLPTSLLSGVLFTLLGAAQHQEFGEAAMSAGTLVFANTLGAMVGPLLAGFVLLPQLGIEKSIFASMLCYGLIASLAPVAPLARQVERHRRLAWVAASMLFAVASIYFHLGLMKRYFIPLVIERYKSGDPKLVSMREGATETVMYLRTSFHDRPLYHRLMTNGHSMSATTFRGRRYMKLYVYWALAVNPSIRRALLISYGVGTTAKALTDTRQLQSIDVVDISRDVLDLAPTAFPETQPPLSDPRVRIHVEDGRFFLQTTGETFDLITAEPPPLRGAGVTSLYSREYFGLVRDRLRDGGVVTYWLPVNQLWPSETKAIIRAFCGAFSDCSLWNGAGLQWMLAGTRSLHGPVPEGQFEAQWRDSVVAPEMADLGFESPESLGTTFLGDAATLDAWSEGTAALDDDHPGYIGSQYPPDEDGDPLYRSWMDPRTVGKRFESSAFIRDLWPAELRRRTASGFGPQAVLDDASISNQYDPINALHDVLALTTMRTLPLLLMGTEPAVQRIAGPLYDAGARDVDLEFEAGARAMSERDYEGAAQHLALFTEGPRKVRAALLRTLALGLAGREAEARECLNSIDLGSLSPADGHSAKWLQHFLRGANRRTGGPPGGSKMSP